MKSVIDNNPSLETLKSNYSVKSNDFHIPTPPDIFQNAQNEPENVLPNERNEAIKTKIDNTMYPRGKNDTSIGPIRSEWGSIFMKKGRSNSISSDIKSPKLRRLKGQSKAKMKQNEVVRNKITKYFDKEDKNENEDKINKGG